MLKYAYLRLLKVNMDSQVNIVIAWSVRLAFLGSETPEELQSFQMTAFCVHWSVCWSLLTCI